MHLENPPVPVRPRIYRLTDVARNQEKIPPCLFTFNRISSTGSAVCISKTHLRRSDFTILLFDYFTFLLILREIGSLHLENPPVPVGPRICRFTDFARNPEKITPCLFTFNRISSTGSAVCISKTHLRRSDPDFTILLFYLFLREIGSLHLENPPVPVGPRNYRLTDVARNPEKIPPCLFTFRRISSTGSAVCISKTHLCRSDFAILLFYYLTILLFYYFTILRILREIGSLHLENPPVPVRPRNYRFPDFARNPEKIPPCLFTFNRISSTGSAVCISKTHLCRSDPDFAILLFH